MARDDARHSAADEPGCRQFDVVLPETERGQVVFHEAHGGRAGFDAHLGTAHLARFRAGFPAPPPQERPGRFAALQHG
ncbi:antibiotic biosynthesis monooxygenase [Dankookia rubra]|uniref:Antibiotic biosynthesis monooxygenase n=2 Tax=Dankookia rubra TaxID=1442381 RepID=A0A4R5QHI1_9PROT|nr:antibiotic biosynthesis monooxygenase [Dankookia rubra]